MKSVEQAKRDYDSVDVPVGVTHGLGEYNHDAIQLEFFHELMDSLGFDEALRPYYFDIRTRMLVPIVVDGPTDRQSDDFLSELQLNEMQTLAATLRTRNSFNYETVHYAKIPLQENTLQYLARVAIDL
jgi:hypothetical protein